MSIEATAWAMTRDLPMAERFALILLADGDPAAPTLFLIHPADRIAWDYRHLARRVWGVQHLPLDPTVPLPGSLDRRP